jgi:hypothetical protein
MEKKNSHQVGIPHIVPMAMDKEQTLEKAELSDRIVARVDSLHTLLSCDTNADVGSLDHAV